MRVVEYLPPQPATRLAEVRDQVEHDWRGTRAMQALVGPMRTLVLRAEKLGLKHALAEDRRVKELLGEEARLVRITSVSMREETDPLTFKVHKLASRLNKLDGVTDDPTIVEGVFHLADAYRDATGSKEDVHVIGVVDLPNLTGMAVVEVTGIEPAPEIHAARREAIRRKLLIEKFHLGLRAYFSPEQIRHRQELRTGTSTD